MGKEGIKRSKLGERGREVGVCAARYLLTRLNLGLHPISDNFSASIEFVNGHLLMILAIVHSHSRLLSSS